MNDRTATINGLTIGAGTSYRWKAYPTGLGTADIRTDDRTRPRRSGVVAADDLLGSRTIVFDIQVEGDYDEIETAITALAEAFAPSSSDTWLDLRISGSPAEYSLLGRTRGCEWAPTRDFTFGVSRARCTFLATDPVKYGPATTTTIALGSAGPGFALPASLPAAIGGSSTTGIGSCPNDGTTAVEWDAVLTGPLTNPRLEDIESGRYLRLVATIAAGETVTLDSSTGAILLNGSAPRPNWLAAGSRWWTLDPGPNSIRLTADTGTGTADITYRPGWA